MILAGIGWTAFVVACVAIGWSVNAMWVAGEFDPYLRRARHKRGRGMPHGAGRVWPVPSRNSHRQEAA